jgi:serine/threonine protein kinase
LCYGGFTEIEAMTVNAIAHYQVLEEIGRGGMGIVYKAQDTRLGRVVAMKCLSSKTLGDSEALQRFQREARTACAVNHPHIVTVYDVGVAQGVHYITSEWVDGRTLRTLLKAPLSVESSLDLARQILDALAAAHRVGIIHRDLKPENIIVRTDGYVKVLDFGLARVIASSPLINGEDIRTQSMTASGQVLGTIAYMSPEQALGRPTDASSDLFSFGIILYEMLVGRHPWLTPTPVDTLHALIHDPPAPLPDLPRGADVLHAVLDKALRKNPSDRYHSARDILSDLDQVPSRAEEVGPTWSTSADQSSLAVLPFVFLTPVEGKESLSLGFADALITSLGNLQNFLVLPTSAILKYPGGSDPAAVGRELQVQHVLQGNIQKLGSRWRVTLQLHDAKARRMVFTSKFDFDLEDVFEIQDQISHRVADSLSGEFRSGTRKTRDRYSKDPYAYDEYLRGLKGSYSDSPEIMEDALRHLSQAIERDPDFALAHAALARVLVYRHRMFDPRRSIGERAEFHSQRALALDPGLPEGHLARAYVLWSQIKKYQGREAIAVAESPVASPESRWCPRRAGTHLLPLRVDDRKPARVRESAPYEPG